MLRVSLLAVSLVKVTSPLVLLCIVSAFCRLMSVVVEVLDMLMPVVAPPEISMPVVAAPDRVRAVPVAVEVMLPPVATWKASVVPAVRVPAISALDDTVSIPVKALVAPSVRRVVAPLSSKSLPVICKSSATTVLVPVLSMVRLPEPSTAKRESTLLSVWVRRSCSVVERTSSLTSGPVSPIPTLPSESIIMRCAMPVDPLVVKVSSP